MGDLTHWLVRSLNGRQYLNSDELFAQRDESHRFPTLDVARDAARENGGIVVRVTVGRGRRHALCNEPHPSGSGSCVLTKGHPFAHYNHASRWPNLYGVGERDAAG